VSFTPLRLGLKSFNRLKICIKIYSYNGGFKNAVLILIWLSLRSLAATFTIKNLKVSYCIIDANILK